MGRVLEDDSGFLFWQDDEGNISPYEEAGVLVLPSSIYSSDLGAAPQDRFRIGLGRRGLAEGLAAMNTYLSSNRH